MKARRRPNLTLEQAQAVRADVDAALIKLAREHQLSVSYLLRLASTGGSAQA